MEIAMKELRFLEKNEYSSTIPLFIECFGNDEEFINEYYGKIEEKGIRIACAIEDGRLASMVHVKPVVAVYDEDAGFRAADSAAATGTRAADKAADPAAATGMDSAAATGTRAAAAGNGVPSHEAVEVSYLLCVGTAADRRGHGLMGELMGFVMAALRQGGEPWCFLVAVDKNDYRHLGFTHDWAFNPDEGELLAADEGLTDCSAAVLDPKWEGTFRPPVKLQER